MCLCTEYDSPSCGHSWISLTEPCSIGANLLTCQLPEPIQSCVAPPYCCPICDGSHDDPAVCQIITGRGRRSVGFGLGGHRSYQRRLEYGSGEFGGLGGSFGFGFGKRRNRDGRRSRIVSRSKHYVREEHGGTGCGCVVM